VSYNRGFSVDRNARVLNNIIRNAGIGVYANSCVIENNQIYNGGITVDYQATTNRRKSIIRNNLISLDKTWTANLLADRNQSADWIGNIIRFNDISRLSSAIDDTSSKMSFDYDATDVSHHLFNQLGTSGTSGFLGGKFKDFTIEDSFLYDTQHPDTFALLKLLITDYDGLNVDGAISFNYGEAKDCLIEGGISRGWANFSLNEFADVLTADSPVITVKDRTFIIEAGDFDWTNVACYLLRTPAKDVDFEFINCKFIIKQPFLQGTPSQHRFIKLDHLGTTLFKDCYFETPDAKDFDLTNTSVSSVSNGVITLENCKTKNVTITPDATDVVISYY